MPTYGSGLGLYPYGESGTAENDEVSSTYEGRHLTVLGTEISSEMSEHSLQQAGHPMVVGENIVGVAFTTETATGKTRYVAFDTEGIWLLAVVATDELGNNAVVAGDELFIHKTNAIISKNDNKNTHCHFGYALGGVTTGQTAIISVKVHWDPDDAEELVGVTGTPYVNDTAAIKFREYYYDAGGGGIVEGERMELNITGTPAVTACVSYKRLLLEDHAAKIVTGRASVIEGRLDIAVGNSTLCTMAVLVLDFNNLNIVQGIANIQASYIALRERSVVAGSMMNNLFHFMDHTVGTTDNQKLLSTNTNGATHSIKCDVNGAHWYILCSNVAPA